MNRLRKFAALPFKDKQLFAEALFLVAAVRTGLWILPFGWVRKWLRRFDGSGGEVERLDRAQIQKVVQSVRAGSRYVPSATCLTQALATQALLRMRGQASSVRFGVDKDENDVLMAHAWVEVNGRIIIGEERGHARFLVLEPSDQAIL